MLTVSLLWISMDSERSNAEGNMFFSPLSISAALSMVYLGARGDTAKEMEKV